VDRDEGGRFLVEGSIAIREALRSGAQIDEIFVIPGTAPDIIEDALESDIAVIEVTEQVLKSLTDTSTPQGIVATAAISEHDVGDLAAAATLLLVLADVRDPGNAGTLIRSAVASGASGIVFARGSVDPLHPKTVRSSAGAMFHIPIARSVGLEAAVEACRASELTVLEANANSERAYEAVDMTRPFALLLGNESWGLPREKRHLVDGDVGIPMAGEIDSVNVGTAGSVLMFEAARQRRLSSAAK
jgi:RNA methyltransferase, TrmH family